MQWSDGLRQSEKKISGDEVQWVPKLFRTFQGEIQGYHNTIFIHMLAVSQIYSIYAADAIHFSHCITEAGVEIELLWDGHL